jgi:hypothetical protein
LRASENGCVAEGFALSHLTPQPLSLEGSGEKGRLVQIASAAKEPIMKPVCYGTKRKILSLIIACGIAALLGHGFAGEQSIGKRDVQDDRPFFAVWNSHSTADTDHGHYHGPYLRFAFWDDGRVVFAKESETENKPLLRGRIAAYRVARLKKALLDSGVFTLKGNCYLVPDGRIVSMMIDLGNQRQMLYWDEVKTKNYGINTNPKPHHLDFIRCWESLNSLGQVACPDNFTTVAETVRPQPTWSLKPPIQSE